MKKSTIGIFVASFFLSCVSGAPPGFPKETKVWTAPLVGSLESDLYLVPVYINDSGPYLFQIDPDSRNSAIDEDIKNAMNIWTMQQADGTSEADKRKQVMVADVKKVSVGDLTVRRKFLTVLANDVLNHNGRRIRGVLGRDIIADSLVLQIDRDKAQMLLAPHGSILPPAGAVPLKYDLFALALERYYRVYVANVSANNGDKLAMHVDLGGRMSSIWKEKQEEMRLPSLAMKSSIVDEFGVMHQVDHGTLLATLDMNGLKNNGVRVVDYHDKKYRKQHLDGSLAQNVLSKYNVTADWHKSTIWFSEREHVDVHTQERLSRWGGDFSGCQTPLCVDAQLLGKKANGDVPAEASEQAPGNVEPLSLKITRSAPGLSQSFEILLGAVDESGKVLMGLPFIAAALPAGRQTVSLEGLGEGYQAASGFKILDMTKVGMRECNGLTCAWELKSSTF